MIGEVREPIPYKPGQPVRVDDEYARNGVAEIFMEVESLAGKRHVAVTTSRHYGGTPEIVEVLSGVFYSRGYQDIDRSAPSVRKAQEIIGRSPHVYLDTALKRTLDYYLDINPEIKKTGREHENGDGIRQGAEAAPPSSARA